MRRVLVTAGAGLIGQCVIKRILRGPFSVVVLDSRPVDLSALEPAEGRVTQVLGRTTDPEKTLTALEGCTDVMHLEWSGSIHDATIEPIRRHGLSVNPALGLLDQAREGGLRFIFASTCPYRGDRLEPSDEEAPLSDRSIYARQKRYVESMAVAYARQFGLPTGSLRIFNAYGSGGRPKLILNQLKSAIENRTQFTINGDGEQVRDFVHVDDVAEAFYAALVSPTLDGDIVNIGTGVGTSMNQLISHVEEISGARLDVIRAPAKGEESRYLVADIDRAAERFDWGPRVDLDTGLRRIFGQ